MSVQILDPHLRYELSLAALARFMPLIQTGARHRADKLLDPWWPPWSYVNGIDQDIEVDWSNVDALFLGAFKLSNISNSSGVLFAGTRVSQERCANFALVVIAHSLAEPDCNCITGKLDI